MHATPDAVCTHVKDSPAPRSVAGPLRGMSVGGCVPAEMGRPNCPQPLTPQQNTRPSTSRAQANSSPTATVAAGPGRETGTGAMVTELNAGPATSAPPQHQIPPFTSTAQVAANRAERETSPTPGPVTATGAFASESVPLPSWPTSFAPQQYA